jgi:hypothetical protein
MFPHPLTLSRRQVLNHRLRAALLTDARRTASPETLQRAAWAGLQDSSPRAALLSLHARLRDVTPNRWDEPPYVQLWGPRFSVYVIASCDIPIFSLGRLPGDAKGSHRALDTAARLRTFLNGRRMPFGEAGRGMRVIPNSLRYAAASGTLLMRWDGARQPHIWNAPEDACQGWDAVSARLELARRYLHVFGPSTPDAFRKWAGIRGPDAQAAFRALSKELIPVRVPAIGDAHILRQDEDSFRSATDAETGVRLLPSGDTFYLAWDAGRELIVPDSKRRAELWTSRVWPGALLMNGEIAGTWRRAAHQVSVELWHRPSAKQRQAIEAEAATLPLPDVAPGQIQVRIVM